MIPQAILREFAQLEGPERAQLAKATRRVILRIRASASVCVRTSRFKVLDRRALRYLIDHGHAEIADEPGIGRVYRLVCTEGAECVLHDRCVA